MSEASIVDLLTTIAVQIGVIGTAFLAALPKLRELSRNAHAAKTQVQNSHTINLRDDIDAKHEQVMSNFESLNKRVGKLERRGLRGLLYRWMDREAE